MSSHWQASTASQIVLLPLANRFWSCVLAQSCHKPKPLEQFQTLAQDLNTGKSTSRCFGRCVEPCAFCMEGHRQCTVDLDISFVSKQPQGPLVGSSASNEAGIHAFPQTACHKTIPYNTSTYAYTMYVCGYM